MNHRGWLTVSVLAVLYVAAGVYWFTKVGPLTDTGDRAGSVATGGVAAPAATAQPG